MKYDTEENVRLPNLAWAHICPRGRSIFLPDLVGFKEVRLCSQSIKLIRRWVRNAMWDGTNLRKKTVWCISFKSLLCLSLRLYSVTRVTPLLWYKSLNINTSIWRIIVIRRDSGFSLRTAGCWRRLRRFVIAILTFQTKTHRIIYLQPTEHKWGINTRIYVVNVGQCFW